MQTTYQRLGFIDGDSTRYDYAKAIGSHASRKANNVRHAENHDLKKDALEYYAKNIAKFKNKQKAAEAIAGKIVPVEIRTVYGWITEYHKNLHSPVESGF